MLKQCAHACVLTERTVLNSVNTVDVQHGYVRCICSYEYRRGCGGRESSRARASTRTRPIRGTSRIRRRRLHMHSRVLPACSAQRAFRQRPKCSTRTLASVRPGRSRSRNAPAPARRPLIGLRFSLHLVFFLALALGIAEQSIAEHRARARRQLLRTLTLASRRSSPSTYSYIRILFYEYKLYSYSFQPHNAQSGDSISHAFGFVPLDNASSSKHRRYSPTPAVLVLYHTCSLYSVH